MVPMSTPEVHPYGVHTTDLTKSYGSVQAVCGIDLAIAPGETVALLGPNGAGKTTTIDMILELTRPDLTLRQGQGPIDNHRGKTARPGRVRRATTLPLGETVDGAADAHQRTDLGPPPSGHGRARSTIAIWDGEGSRWCSVLARVGFRRTAFGSVDKSKPTRVRTGAGKAV
jgi:energy-coupling factor transporter ATP-binding protein EcfA2